MKRETLMGIDIGGTKTAISIGTVLGDILDKKSFPTKRLYSDVIKDIYGTIDTFKNKIDINKLQAIGISCGGPLDSENGLIQSPPNLPSWDNIPIVKMLSDRYGVPTFLENDANACALAEWYWGNGKGSASLIFLTFGTGLGAGLILDNRLYRGSSGLAGEIGHWKIAEDGPECYAKRGSWEGFSSGCGISGLYLGKTGINLSAKEICTLATEKDRQALEIIKMSAHKLGLGLSYLVDLLNPEKIIIGSIFTRSEELFRGEVERVLKTECLTGTYQACEILPSKLDDNLGDMAALGIARDGLVREGNSYGI